MDKVTLFFKLWWSKFRHWLYGKLIDSARKLKTIQIEDALEMANKPTGYEYFGNLILGLGRAGDQNLTVLYQCPNKKFHLVTVSAEDFMHGIALLPIANKRFPMESITRAPEDRFGVGMIRVLFEGRLDQLSETVEELTDDEKAAINQWLDEKKA